MEISFFLWRIGRLDPQGKEAGSNLDP